MKKNAVVLIFFAFVTCNLVAQNSIEYGSNPNAGKCINISDIKVYYEIYGEGEPLLLLHGNSGSIESFIYQIPELSKHFRVIAVDSRAQGRTTDSEKEITYALMASDMAELIDRLNLGKVNVVGWSDGGNIGLELAFSHPEKVIKVVAIGANYTHENYLAPPDSVMMMPDDPLIIRASAMIKRFGSAFERLSPDTARKAIIQKKLAELMEKYPNFTPDQLHTINVPFLVVAGDHDLININQTIELFANLPKAQLFVVPGASHIVPAENPELINSEVIKFLKTPYRDIDPYYFFKIPK
ncbi:MAG: alpha/beta hydrolase [Prolixibacteraceae bacterium]|nr:alpha/beta hydrolase [Prolixibacteraceae bacterium]